jgi:hypothetical protein
LQHREDIKKQLHADISKKKKKTTMQKKRDEAVKDHFQHVYKTIAQIDLSSGE